MNQNKMSAAAAIKKIVADIEEKSIKVKWGGLGHAAYLLIVSVVVSFYNPAIMVLVPFAIFPILGAYGSRKTSLNKEYVLAYTAFCSFLAGIRIVSFSILVDDGKLVGTEIALTVLLFIIESALFVCALILFLELRKHKDDVITHIKKHDNPKHILEPEASDQQPNSATNQQIDQNPGRNPLNEDG